MNATNIEEAKYNSAIVKLISSEHNQILIPYQPINHYIPIIKDDTIVTRSSLVCWISLHFMEA